MTVHRKGHRDAASALPQLPTVSSAAATTAAPRAASAIRMREDAHLASTSRCSLLCAVRPLRVAMAHRETAARAWSICAARA